eukprot:m51a1_g8559 putative peptidase domain-containing protein (518) ;mRNA; r:166546-168378
MRHAALVLSLVLVSGALLAGSSLVDRSERVSRCGLLRLALSYVLPSSVLGDGDGDGHLDCYDACPGDPAKFDSAGLCGCGAPDSDSDGDETPDCDDYCPDDPRKLAPGLCGCGLLDGDWAEPADCASAYLRVRRALSDLPWRRGAALLSAIALVVVARPRGMIADCVARAAEVLWQAVVVAVLAGLLWLALAILALVAASLDIQIDFTADEPAGPRDHGRQRSPHRRGDPPMPLPAPDQRAPSGHATALSPAAQPSSVCSVSATPPLSVSSPSLLLSTPLSSFSPERASPLSPSFFSSDTPSPIECALVSDTLLQAAEEVASSSSSERSKKSRPRRGGRRHKEKQPAGAQQSADESSSSSASDERTASLAALSDDGASTAEAAIPAAPCGEGEESSDVSGEFICWTEPPAEESSGSWAVRVSTCSARRPSAVKRGARGAARAGDVVAVSAGGEPLAYVAVSVAEMCLASPSLRPWDVAPAPAAWLSDSALDCPLEPLEVQPDAPVESEGQSQQPQQL